MYKCIHIHNHKLRIISRFFSIHYYLSILFHIFHHIARFRLIWNVLCEWHLITSLSPSQLVYHPSDVIDRCWCVPCAQGGIKDGEGRMGEWEQYQDRRAEQEEEEKRGERRSRGRAPQLLVENDEMLQRWIEVNYCGVGGSFFGGAGWGWKDEMRRTILSSMKSTQCYNVWI